MQFKGFHAVTRNCADLKLLPIHHHRFILASALAIAACYRNGVAWAERRDVLILDDFHSRRSDLPPWVRPGAALATG